MGGPLSCLRTGSARNGYIFKTYHQFPYPLRRSFAPLDAMLSDADRTALQNALCDDETVRLAYLFGSHAQDRAGEASDVDVAVLTESDDNELRQLVDLKTMLEEKIDRTVDVTLVPVCGTDPRLLNQVLQHGELLYARDEKTRVDFETSARSKYLDMKPHIEEYDRRVREDLTS